MRLAAAPITWAGSSSNFRPVRRFESLGLRPSAFIDVGSLWDITHADADRHRCNLSATTASTGYVRTIPGAAATIALEQARHVPPTTTTRAAGFKEVFLGNSPKPRLSIGIGVNWVSPFGPLRLDLAKALLKQKGDDTKLFSFNVGTQF